MGVLFGGNFWVFETFKNVFGMRMGDFGGVYLVKFIDLRAFYIIFADVHDAADVQTLVDV